MERNTSAPSYTIQKLAKEYLSFYIPCECTVPSLNNDIVGRIIGIKEDVVYINHPDSGVNETLIDLKWNDEFVCKLLLRPFNSITADEMKELYYKIFKKKFPDSGRIAFFDDKTTSYNPRWVLMSGVDRLGIETNWTIWADCDLHHIKFNQHEITRHLVAKQFDLFDLIGCGLANDKTKYNGA